MTSFEHFEKEKYRKLIQSCAGAFLIGAFFVLVAACVGDNKCGDDMKLVSKEVTQTVAMCTPIVDTEVPKHTDDPVDGPDGGTTPGDTDAVTTCTGTNDCPGNAYCDLTLSRPICKDPPTGEGTPCETDAECAGYEADYCENWVSFTCLKIDCSQALNDCSDDHICCDFAMYGLPSICVARELNGDTCPAK